MRATRRRPADRRRGKVLVMMALLLPFFMGVVALSADLAVLATARGQLQTVADSAALAGAMKLASTNRLKGATDLSTEMTSARTAAKSMAADNAVLGAAGVLNDNATNASTGDIVVGYLDPKLTSGALSFATQSLYNSVQVTAYRNSTHTGVVPAFFSSVLGFRGTNVTVSATATVENLSITGVQSVNGVNANLIPIALDQTTYKSMIAGTTTDQYTYNAATDTVTAGADGITESQLYPVANGDPGNWGTINVGVSNNSTSTISAQIRYGITPAQMANYPNSQITLDSTKTPPSISFSANPGISAGMKDDLAAIIGKPVAIPIYDQTSGNGNNATYRVVDFAVVRLLTVSMTGNPKYVIVQPALLTYDQTLITGSAESSWRAGGVIHVYLSR